MAEFKQLGLQQGMVAGVIHQADVILEFGVKANREYVLRNETGCASSR